MINFRSHLMFTLKYFVKFSPRWIRHSAAQILTGTFNMVVQHAHLRSACYFLKTSLSNLFQKQPNECLLYPASLRAMDGNNSAKCMVNAGSTDCCIFPSRYMIPPDQVDIFKDDVQLCPGECGVKQPTSCTDHWKAANSTDGNTVHVFEQTNIFLSARRHGIVQTVTEMCCSGEL
jgi:hypothetical protein